MVKAEMASAALSECMQASLRRIITRSTCSSQDGSLTLGLKLLQASRIVHKLCCLGLCLCPAALCAAQMRHLAVYMMLVLGGNATPSKEDVTKALSTVGIEADEARLDHLLSELEGKYANEWYQPTV
eukprot:13164-Heterococcus_DN1.PRE.1